jgi:hypothetical protein
MSHKVYSPDELRAVIDEVLAFAKAHAGKPLGEDGWKELDRLDEKAGRIFDYFGLTAPEVPLTGGITERGWRMKFPLKRCKAPPEYDVASITVIENSAEWFQGLEQLKATEKPTPEAERRNEQVAKEEAAREKLSSLLSCPVKNANRFCTWLSNAEAFVRSLPDKTKDGTEWLSTQNSRPLCEVAGQLHRLANEHAPEAAAQCTLPGLPTHFSKAEVLRNFGLLTNFTGDRGSGAEDHGGDEVAGVPLSPLQMDILDALRLKKALDFYKRKTGREITAAVGGDATTQSVKAPLADLKKRLLVDSRTGRNGGTWLTSEGLNLINSLRRKP